MIIENVIRKYALKNALEHDKAMPGVIVPKVLGEDPSLRNDMKSLMTQINKIVTEVNKLTKDKITKELQAHYPEMLEKKEERKGLSELEGAVEGKVLMRLAPFPSGDIHVGNIRGMIINDEYVKKYHGKLLLVLDDTIGSEEKPIMKEAYDMIPESITWLGINYEPKIIYKSDRLEHYYKYGLELLNKNKAYVCECPSELIRDYRSQGVECSHRKQSTSENINKWQRMLEGKFKEGTACVRLKTNMKEPDPAFRDRVLFRISDKEHPRAGTKYKVWPMLEMSWAVDDMLLGITHIVRGKELMIEGRMEEYIWDILEYKNKPLIKLTGLFQIEGVKISKSKARKEIESGEYTGWDDPRTWNMHSLKRRGFKPEALREFILSMGLSLAEIKVPVDSLYTINRRLIDPTSLRYFFVKEPIKLVVTDCKEAKAEIPMHHEIKKSRSYVITEGVNEYYIAGSDIELLKTEKQVRMKDLMNIDSIKNAKTIQAKYAKDQKEVYNIRKIQFVTNDNIPCKILREDGTTEEGLCEGYCKNIQAGEIIQFERYGFCKLEKKSSKEMQFILTHP